MARSSINITTIMKKLSLNKGMTLAEVLVTLAIFLLIMGAVAAFEANVFIYGRFSSDSLQTIQDSQIILKNISREVRNITVADDGSYPIANVSTSSMTVFSDFDDNGSRERIRYSLVKNTLYRAITVASGNPPTYSGQESTSTIVTNIRNSSSTPVFEYYDQNYDGAGNPMSYPVNIPSIRLIRVNLTLDIDPNRSPLPKTYSTSITLRNLKSNL
jgi:prepilin-type N-terminal cleavage/methylation domain-containing protein